MRQYKTRIQPFAADVFLSAHPEDVAHALAAGVAAATILPSKAPTSASEQLRIAFDGDAVLFGDESERVSQEQGLDAFHRHETEHAAHPLPGGPFRGFLDALHRIQSAFPLEQSPIRTATSGEFAVIPMFLLMGALASTSGMSRELFRAANSFLGHFKGGLGIATIAACGGFAAICGSSVATAATFSSVAYPEMRRYGYPQSFATGVVAAGLRVPGRALVRRGGLLRLGLRRLGLVGCLRLRWRLRRVRAGVFGDRFGA